MGLELKTLTVGLGLKEQEGDDESVRGWECVRKAHEKAQRREIKSQQELWGAIRERREKALVWMVLFAVSSLCVIVN